MRGTEYKQFLACRASTSQDNTATSGYSHVSSFREPSSSCVSWSSASLVPLQSSLFHRISLLPCSQGHGDKHAESPHRESIQVKSCRCRSPFISVIVLVVTSPFKETSSLTSGGSDLTILGNASARSIRSSIKTQCTPFSGANTACGSGRVVQI